MVESRKGLYYLIIKSLTDIDDKLLQNLVSSKDAGNSSLACSFNAFSPTVDTTVNKVHNISCNTPHAKQNYVSVWLHRLGHAPLQKLRYIYAISFELPSACSDNCLTCPMAKMDKLPFPMSQSKTTKPFELIHFDIWGPYRTTTHKNFIFFITILDDYSRSTWIFLLQNKSQSLSILQQFQNFVNTV